MDSPDDIAERAKRYELALDTAVDPALPTVIRLDGHCFSRLTAMLSKPFDPRLHAAMVATASDLLSQYALLLFFLSCCLL